MNKSSYYNIFNLLYLLHAIRFLGVQVKRRREFRRLFLSLHVMMNTNNRKPNNDRFILPFFCVGRPMSIQCRRRESA
jgi:hypothetical protein